MLKKTLVSIMVCSTIMLAGCDAIKSLSQKAPLCNDATVLETLEETLRKQVLDATKAQLQFSQANTDVGLIKEAVNHLKINLDEISNPQKGADSHKNVCEAKLTIGLHKTLLERAEVVRKAKGELPLQDFAFRQNIELIATQIQHDLTYNTLLDKEKIKVELEKSEELQEFIAKIIVDASEQPKNGQTSSPASSVSNTPVQPPASVATAIVTPSVASITPANKNDTKTDTKTNTTTPKTVGPAGEKPSTTVDTDAVSQAEMSKIEREKAKAKAQLDFKRKEFNTLWNSATPEAQESLLDDQKQWVKDRDETCLAEAQEAEPAYQETERMRCQARLLGERYYEVKEYFENYE